MRHCVTALVSLIVAFLTVAAPVSEAASGAPKSSVIAFGLWGDQSVFLSEATQAADIVAHKYGHGGPVIVRANTKRATSAMTGDLAEALQVAATGMDRDNDVLFLILSSHGSPAGIAVKAGRRYEVLTPLGLKSMLDRSGIRNRIVIVSACYSGIFTQDLADPRTAVITAADANHPSFGCRDGASWTYFGDAFFNKAMRHAKTLNETFLAARAIVRTRELRNGFDPSNPQMVGGEEVLARLEAHH